MAPLAYDSVADLVCDGDDDLSDPAPKQDFVASPLMQVGTGAMEDWGAISVKVSWWPGDHEKKKR